MEEIAFKYAVDHINRNRELLPRSRVMAQIERVPPHDSFYASKRGEQHKIQFEVFVLNP